jgi:hypothetical protein
MEYRRTIERTFEAGDAPRLRIANRSGRLAVHGRDRSDIAFTATLRVDAGSEGEANELFDAVDLPISERGGEVEIGPPTSGSDGGGGFRSWFNWTRRVRIDMLAEVPRDCRVDARNRAGAIAVEGIGAAVTVDGRAGGVSLRDIEGALSASTRAGGIQLESIRGPVQVATHAGSIEAERVTGDLSLETHAGSVRVRIVDGDVDVTTRAGGITLEDVSGAVRVRGRHGGVKYRGRVTDAVEISVATGGIEFGVPLGSSFFLDAESGRGSVVSELEVDVTREPAADAPTVRLRTEVGSIRLVSAYD